MLTDFESKPHEATVTGLRGLPQTFSLQANGFTVARLTPPHAIDWDDAEAVKTLYYPLAKQLLQVAPSAEDSSLHNMVSAPAYLWGVSASPAA